MGWRIEHPGNGPVCKPSYTSMDNLGKHLAHALSAADWARIRHLFGRNGDPFHLSAKAAADAARLLRKAADHSKMPPDWGRLARQLAHSAQAAADRNVSWHWE